MRILGIDPGLRLCGYAVIDKKQFSTSLIEAGIFKTNAKLPLEFRLQQIAEDVSSLIKNFKPEYMAIEQLYSNYLHPRTAILMGHARGVILQQAANAKIEVKDFAATRIKNSLTGNGRAGKPQMQRTIQSVLGLAEMPEPHDVADAIAIALCGANTI